MCRADSRQDCECDEGCYYCMIMLRLKVSHSGTGSDKYMNVTSNMLEVIPSPGGVSISPLLSFGKLRGA